ncbi:MAG TPA: hypothetical protein VEK82_14470 [Stellaceae bacterium]|nr:hypothetical protein [Stellaceae bacterium]
MIRLTFLVLALALAASPASAEPVYDLGMKAPVPHDKTWRDLVRQIFPDLTQEPGPSGRTSDFIHGKISLRPIDDEAFGGDCPDPPRIEYLEFGRVEIARKTRLIVGITTEGDACVGALALFDGAGESKLLDVVNIQQDANYAFGPDFVRSLGTDGRLVIATSFHTTTSTSPDNAVLILATEDKLSLIGNVVAQSERGCRRAVAEDGFIAIVPDYGPFARITGYVKRSVRRLAADCATQQGKEAVTITHTDWRWNPAVRAYRKVSP